MTLYSTILFVHVAAVLVLSGALSIETLSLFHLRRASTLAEVQPWMEPVPRLPLLAVGALLIILFSGIYLVIPISAAGRAWPKIAVAALLLMAPFGATTDRRMRAIRETYQAQRVMNSGMLGRLRDPFFKISLGVRIGVFQGIFLLVNAKPGLWESIGIVGGSALLGFILSLLSSRGNATAVMPTAGLGD
jgi:hypothetical protein